MSKTSPQDERIEREIADLKREIAKLSALLALRKAEAGHPALRKLVQEIDKALEAMHKEGAAVARFGHEHFGGIAMSRIGGAIGSILLIGSVGYAIALALGWAGPGMPAKANS